MPWITPRAKAIFERIASALETSLLVLRPDADPRKVSLAVRSSAGVFSQILRAISPEIRELHDHQSWWGRQYMPDSADDESMIRRHSSIWGVDGRPAIVAVGSVLIEGLPTTALPSGIALSAGNGQLYKTTSVATIGPGGTIIVAAASTTAGLSGNLEAGIRLSTVVAYPEITKVTVSTAFAGGADEPAPEELKAAYLERIRNPPHGGASGDYPVWVKEVADALAVKVVPEWIGRGSVGVVVTMQDEDGLARVATEDEIEAIQAYLGPQSSALGVKPVTARVIVVPAVLEAIPISVRLRPDTAATRLAVTEAFTRFIASIGDEEDQQNDSPIGALIERSRVSEAISAASGEYAHDLIVPAASYTLSNTHHPITGTITWVPA
jgi:uncharacterized phage protein gp47/JayE